MLIYGVPLISEASASFHVIFRKHGTGCHGDHVQPVDHISYAAVSDMLMFTCAVGLPMQTTVAVSVSVAFSSNIVCVSPAGYIAPWSGRFYSLWDTG